MDHRVRFRSRLGPLLLLSFTLLGAAVVQVGGGIVLGFLRMDFFAEKLSGEVLSVRHALHGCQVGIGRGPGVGTEVSFRYTEASGVVRTQCHAGVQQVGDRVTVLQVPGDPGTAEIETGYLERRSGEWLLGWASLGGGCLLVAGSLRLLHMWCR